MLRFLHLVIETTSLFLHQDVLYQPNHGVACGDYPLLS